jgi:hypothetical protein
MKRLLLTTLVLLALGVSAAAPALAGYPFPRIVRARANAYPWNAPYYDTAWGTPVALVVPPTAEYQTNWGWGAGNTRVTPIWHQFQRPYPGPVSYDPRAISPTPPWPSDTAQFGDYYVRGPW